MRTGGGKPPSGWEEALEGTGSRVGPVSPGRAPAVSVVTGSVVPGTSVPQGEEERLFPRAETSGCWGRSYGSSFTPCPPSGPFPPSFHPLELKVSPSPAWALPAPKPTHPCLSHLGFRDHEASRCPPSSLTSKTLERLMPRLVIMNVALCAATITVLPKTPFLFSLLFRKNQKSGHFQPHYPGPCDGDHLSIIYAYALTFNSTTPLPISKPFFE